VRRPRAQHEPGGGIERGDRPVAGADPDARAGERRGRGAPAPPPHVGRPQLPPRRRERQHAAAAKSGHDGAAGQGDQGARAAVGGGRGVVAALAAARRRPWRDPGPAVAWPRHRTAPAFARVRPELAHDAGAEAADEFRGAPRARRRAPARRAQGTQQLGRARVGRGRPQALLRRARLAVGGGGGGQRVARCVGVEPDGRVDARRAAGRVVVEGAHPILIKPGRRRRRRQPGLERREKRARARAPERERARASRPHDAARGRRRDGDDATAVRARAAGAAQGVRARAVGGWDGADAGRPLVGRRPPRAVEAPRAQRAPGRPRPQLAAGREG
jgi:hypothetical protein